MKRTYCGGWRVRWLLLVLLVVLIAPGLQAAETADGSEDGPDVELAEPDKSPETSNKQKISYEEGEGLHVGNHVTIFGYAELHYNNPIGTTVGDQFDFHRFAVGIGVDFTDWLKFESELDFEHGASEVNLEMAYLDFLIRQEFNARTGIVLTPVGFLNEYHEPTFFYSVERPLYNTVIIPTTWFGAGVGFHGETAFGLQYAGYAMESLDAIGFSGSKGLRGGRRKTAEAPGSDIAGTMRVAYQGVPGLKIGASVWLGDTAQGNLLIDGGWVTLAEADARYAIEGIELTFAGSWIFIQDAAGINAAIQAVNPGFTDFVASQLLGGYAELAYHVFHHAWPKAPFDIVIFGRHERINTQHKMPAGFAADPANNRRRTTIGLSVFPIPQVALKVDYDFNRNDAGTGVDQFNAGLALVY